MFQTTRRRLAFWYTTVTAVLLLLFASGFYLYVRGTLIERIDDTLNHVVEVVERSLVIEPTNPHLEGSPLRVNVEASFRDSAATDEDDHIDLEWYSPTGELVWSTFTEPLDIPLNPSNSGETVKSLKEPEEPLILRQVTHRIQIGRQVLGYLRVSHPWFEVTKPTRQLFFDLILWTALIIAAVGAIGWFLSGLAMEPVRESYQRLKQFTADASHELRSPIAIIQTNVQVALADPDPQPQTQQQHLKVVERLTRRLGRLVDDLLFLARQDSGMVQFQRSAVAVDGLLKEVCEEQETLAAEKGIELCLHLEEPTLKLSAISVPTQPPITSLVQSALTAAPDTLPGTWATLYADRDQLARLFTNLIGNAVQYTPTGGQVNVGLKQIKRQSNRFLQITVSDTGIGIPPEALSKLFDRFYRVDPSRSQTSAAGSGLGLAIAQAIVENHQGQIHIESTPNAGTTVTVTLPQKE
ncbi:sensor histidine kinase [Leptothermofonsia sp. ETS-13]|uniref:sensor histidine kinase n=1 Tax=Leptothermofonsia sp. ETS-13 TaxID=3035696 RepID=UPI003BA0E893